MSDCGHPPTLVTVNSVGADGQPYQSVKHEPCTCRTPPQPQHENE
ncbi:hypothetical protein AB0F20_26205 [Streptomyces goshikiensis]